MSCSYVCSQTETTMAFQLEWKKATDNDEMEGLGAASTIANIGI